MAKLFADRLNILESKINEIQPIRELQNRVEECEAELRELKNELTETNAKIKQVIDEITPIITSHANALKALLNNDFNK
jgi:uncharacterized coiled-coil DUF342 family protein